jgi:hypothetical protein
MLYGLKSLVVDKRLTAKSLHSILSQHIKSHLPIKIKFDTDISQAKGLVYIGGMYYACNDQEDRRQIEIIFSYQEKDSILKLSERRWSRMCSLFADTVLHEIIHLRQYRARNFKAIDGYQSVAALAKDRRNQEYYGHKDEIGAYAFNIACELKTKFNGDDAAIIRYLDSNLAKRSKKGSYYYYLKAFDWNHKHPVIRSLKKKIIRNLPYAEIGKPFKTDTWLTY